MSQGYTITMALNGKAFNAMPAYLKAMTSKLAERIVIVTNGPIDRNTEVIENLDEYILKKAPENKHFRIVIRIRVSDWEMFFKWYVDFFHMIARSKTMQAEYLAMPDEAGEPPSHWSNKANGEDRLGYETIVYFEHMDVNEL